MASKLYQNTSIKSKVFLFPLLGTSRNAEYSMLKSYIICEDKDIDKKSMKLLVSYANVSDASFVNYDKKILSGNKLFVENFYNDNGKEIVYVFDFSSMSDTWNKFLKGKYSQFSNDIKKRIIAYHELVSKDPKTGVEKKKTNRLILEVFYPENPTETDTNGKKVRHEDAFHKYAPDLGIDAEEFRLLGEIYSKPNFKDETLVLVKNSLEIE